jgi:hypothetical protein
LALKQIHISLTNDKVIVKDKAGLFLQSTLTEEVSLWLSELNHSWIYFRGNDFFEFEFEEDQDALLFKLIWG